MLRNELKRADLLLLLFYIAYCAAVVLRVHVEETGYISPDSRYYLEAARSFTAGDNFMIRDLYSLNSNKLIPFTAWPVGYPFLIAVVKWLSGLSLFWASKLVNLLFVGFSFLLLRHVNRAYSFVLASMYAAFTFLEVYSYTWSEAIFLFGCLCFVLVLFRLYTTGNIILVYLLLAIAAFLFLSRYIGFFAGAVILLFAVITRFEDRKELSNHLFIAFALNVLLVWGYVLHNYYVAGYNTDIQRIDLNIVAIPQTFWLTAKGLLIELFLIRKYYLHGQIDELTIATTVLQVAVISYIMWLLKSQRSLITAEIKQCSLSYMALIVAAVYLFVLVTLRIISPFDAPDYRLLSPVSLLVLFAILAPLTALPDSVKGAKRAKYIVFGFFLFSLLLNLPKAYILSQLKQVF